MSAVAPISVSSIADEAFHKLAEAIVAGEFAPGERLSETDLARRFAISRGPIREALGRLEGKLVTRTRRLGASVIDLSPENLVDLFIVREALEGMAARLAAERMTDAVVATLQALLAQHGGHSDVASGVGYYQDGQDDDFHFLIARSARNGQLATVLLDELYFKLKFYRYRISSALGRTQKALEEHHEIADRIAARDPDGAEAAMRRHIRNAIESAVGRMASDGKVRET